MTDRFEDQEYKQTPLTEGELHDGQYKMKFNQDVQTIDQSPEKLADTKTDREV